MPIELLIVGALCALASTYGGLLVYTGSSSFSELAEALF